MSDLTNSHAAESFILLEDSVDLPADTGSSISRLAPLEAILFDVDGTLCDSDPMHYYAFREMLLEIGYNNSVPITEEDFIEKVAGKNSEDIANTLFPDWDREKAMKFIDDKEARFRKLASKQLEAIDGLYKLRKWTEDRGLKRAAVTNAPRPNAELMISILGLSDFFQHMVIGSECERAKPFPDPYLKALNLLNASPEHSLVFDDSASGIKAGVAAGMPVVGVMTRNPEKSLKDAGASLLIKDYNDPKLWKALEDLEKAEATLKKADV
ncbi:haloacid dehalogenase-like hydrolase domain-containing protein Sgpp isoform X2 [Phoenix dactylifera]|uniref:Haloacid dehalogenase-like hydrolase domain-containing protein Sgpp isoform X2 n=1 Tax=Phoenix dactylifera TaxID=42345 RepID=A0A8B8J491_PHODC|nr:haloacid dehalogenase-like hydrolase domain-containing protein Sgpp isoform X2 [Phoenix dactylifera]